MQLIDRVALITGGRRMGAVVATELAARGANVALAFNHSRSEAEATAALVRERGRRAVIKQADLSRAGDCELLVNEVTRELGRLDVLINMASVYAAKPFEELTEADWNASLRLDLTASYLCARAAIPHMRAVGGGRIINFSDWVARSGRPRYRDYLPYYVAKVAIIGLTEALALELASDNILVNALAPGPILAPAELDAEGRDAVERATPLGRWGGEEEIAKAVLALIDSDFITGETVRVDGGRHIK